MGTALRRTFRSKEHAEEWVARLWIAIEKHKLQTPRMQVRLGFGLTITIYFPDHTAAELIMDELHRATL